MRVCVCVPAVVARRAAVLLGTLLLACALGLPLASADSVGAQTTDALASGSRLSSADPLNGGTVIVNMHGMLFHPDVGDIQDDVSYARWLGGGVIRVFATDSHGLLDWDGQRVGTRIADIAPMLRAANVRLIVALVNNHRAVPEESASSAGWLDNYWQLLLPFYTSTWRGAYQSFVNGLISTVDSRGARDVMYAWELGNELHTPTQPEALMPFITAGAALVRSLDPLTPILPGTMGANHIEPGNPDSPIARWLYCEAPVDAYTLHAYDWVSPQRPGDMPINWDLDAIAAQPCSNGRSLPIIVEELGTSRALPGVYSAEDERGRLQQELHQIDFIRSYPQVAGFGVWNAESPRLADRAFFDTRRGLTSYGSNAGGGGSCYDPAPDPAPGVRCLLEQTLRGLRSVRADGAGQWTLAPDMDAPTPPIVQVDGTLEARADTMLTFSGRISDPSPDQSAGVETVEARLDRDGSDKAPLASASVSLPPATDSGAGATAVFQLNVPLAELPTGSTTLVLSAHSPIWGTWLNTFRLEAPVLGPDPALRSVSAVALTPPQALAPLRAAEIQSPQPGGVVPRTFVLQMLAPRADRVDVFLEPGRDRGGRLVGSAFAESSSNAQFRVLISVPVGQHTLYVHAQSSQLGTQEILNLPIVVT
ncbi:MAG: hypothetical protein ACR2IK_20950 [Chloroflexota bacterium]